MCRGWQLLRHVTIASGGVLPKIHPELLAKKKGGKFITGANTPVTVPYKKPIATKPPAHKKVRGRTRFSTRGIVMTFMKTHGMTYLTYLNILLYSPMTMSCLWCLTENIFNKLVILFTIVYIVPCMRCHFTSTHCQHSCLLITQSTCTRVLTHVSTSPGHHSKDEQQYHGRLSSQYPHLHCCCYCCLHTPSQNPWLPCQCHLRLADTCHFSRNTRTFPNCKMPWGEYMLQEWEYSLSVSFSRRGGTTVCHIARFKKGKVSSSLLLLIPPLPAAFHPDLLIPLPVV